MNKDSNLLDLTGWQPPEFFTPWIPFKNPVHPPPATAPTSEKTLDHLIILALHYPPSSVSRVNNSLVSLSSNPLADLSINPFQFPCPRHCTVNKHFTEKLCLLNCFLHVGQIR
ncbi:hypothetical protein ATANTOWER_028983 [Ataeniobius toweri]|uniref:Uncharacterized protein n=1 Tax=Ataeniobius toweri TaxID=208326 RepID=A0ABU7ASG9_9TELE|nr:hypothetical protein [Ataeniobius toweri]